MTSKHSLLGIPSCAALVFLLAIAPGIGWGQSSAPATTPVPLPPEAQAAVNKGIIAAKVADYLLAIRHFEEARKIAPAAPDVFFNLGLAESKIPGRELRAIAWFGAYLAANPTAPNAAAVKEQIDVLNVKSQSNLSRLIKSVQDAANQIPDHKKSSNGLAGVANLLAESGDIAGALKTAELIRDTHDSSTTHFTIATFQQDTGDIVGSRKTVDLIQEANIKHLAQGVLLLRLRHPPAAGSGGRTIIAAVDWLKELDSIDKTNHCPLHTEPFLDLAGYLKILPGSDDSEKIFWRLYETAKKIVTAKNVINGMLEQKTKP